MSGNDWIAEMLPRLTWNAAINLKAAVEHPSDHAPTGRLYPFGHGRIWTGSGKYTHLAALGVERHMIAAGVAEVIRWKPAGSPAYTAHDYLVLTERGVEVANYLRDHWDAVLKSTTFRDGRRR